MNGISDSALQGFAKWFTFSIFENVCVVIFVVANVTYCHVNNPFVVVYHASAIRFTSLDIYD